MTKVEIKLEVGSATITAVTEEITLGQFEQLFKVHMNKEECMISSLTVPAVQIQNGELAYYQAEINKLDKKIEALKVENQRLMSRNSHVMVDGKRYYPSEELP